MKKELQDIENRILFLLSNSKGNILDDHELIETLASSKKTSTEITLKVRVFDTSCPSRQSSGRKGSSRCAWLPTTFAPACPRLPYGFRRCC